MLPTPRIQPTSQPKLSHIIRSSQWPLGVFLISRLGLFLLVYLSLAIIPPNSDPDLVAWDLFGDVQMLNGWARWDAGWYKDIAEFGYTDAARYEDQRNLVFFPLYPLLVRGLRLVIPHTGLSGLIVSNLACAVGLVVLYHLLRIHYDQETGKWGTVLAATFPFSFYFSAFYSEALFFALVVCTFFFAHRSQWAVAALCAALAGATRSLGSTLALGLLLVYLEQIHFQVRRIRLNILWLAVAPLGLVAYMLFLWNRFGDPFLFATFRHVEGWEVAPWQQLTYALGSVFTDSALLSGTYPVAHLLNLATGFAAMGLIIRQFRKLGIAYSVWALVYLVLAFYAGWRGLGRYAIPVFPLYIALALLLDSTNKRLVFLYFSTLLLALLSVLYSHWYWVS